MLRGCVDDGTAARSEMTASMPFVLKPSAQAISVIRLVGDEPAASGDYRQNGCLGLDHPHVVLALGHVLLGRAATPQAQRSPVLGAEMRSSRP
jgi:hypothetical protein